MTASLPVVVAGDANLDLVLTGDVVPRFGQVEQLIDGAQLVLGGSSAITAAGVARLGIDTQLVAVVGGDDFGRLTVEALEARGVGTEAIRRDTALPSGLSVILSTPGDRSILTLPGTIPALEADAVLAVLGGIERPGILHVGSYFLQPTLAARLPEVFAAARSAGWLTSLDTNWDPSEQWAGLKDVLPVLDVLLPNAAELRALATALGADPEASDTELATGLAVRGPRVVVKDGSRGGWSVGGDGVVVRAPAISVHVVDTTGAGDSFNAGYLAALAEGRPEGERLAWATVAGGLSTRGAGGTGAQADRAELVGRLEASR